MNNLINEVTAAISNAKSYVKYRKIISSNWPFLDKQLSTGPYNRYAENLYLFLNGLSERPRCANSHCNIELKYIDRTEGYRKFCSTKCSASSDEVKNQHNIANANRSDQDKQAIVDKRHQTMINRHGFPHALQCPEFKDKYNLKIQDVDWKSVADKRTKTYLDKYGVDNIWNLPSFREKIKQTNLEKYGVEWVQQNHDVVSKRTSTRNKVFFENLFSRVTSATPLFTVDDYDKVDQKYPWVCNSCLTTFIDHIDDGTDPICPKCFPGGKLSSLGEKQLVNFIYSLGITNVLQNVRYIIPPKEIDIWLPDYNLGIEFNGLYWHTEKRCKTKFSHFNKWKTCNDQGIRLIQIFSDEWQFKQNIVKNRLKHFLNKSEKTCNARQCIIQSISTKDYNQFMNNIHIQGSCVSSIRYGAFYNNKLVAAMSFGKNRAIHKCQGWELLRFASLGNIPGIAGKIFKKFINEYNPDFIFSYCDLRWGTGKVYESIGMTLDSITPPGYWYSKDFVTRLHRFKFTKQKLIEQGFDSNLTESQITEQLGYHKIWDVGHKKFVWHKI